MYKKLVKEFSRLEILALKERIDRREIMADISEEIIGYDYDERRCIEKLKTEKKYRERLYKEKYGD